MITRLNMIPFDYEWAYRMHEDGWMNTWFPSQIGMGRDRLDLQGLAPEVQRVYRTNLANLTTSDVEIMDNVALGVQTALVRLGVMDAPEIRMYLNRQADEESLHTRSYQHILESIGMDPGEQESFYNLWREEPAMRAKVAYAAGRTRQLMDGPHTLRGLVEALAFYTLIYEGGWFFSGFNPNFAIARHYNATPGTVEQLQYILRDETMHIAFGTRMINTIRQEAMTFGKPDPLHQDAFHSMCHQAEELEADYAAFLLPTPILGYGATGHMDYFRHLANRRCAAMGFTPAFAYNAADPFPWRAEMAEIAKEKNFFETHVTEYRTGADLKWEE